ncbi:MAG TPA: branched-chain amino acid ABC transporter permease [Magnetospirillaceae bacterium]|jgi:branched-chain amino acid transport system permease protein
MKVVVHLLRRHWLWPAAIVAALLLPFAFFDWAHGHHSGFVLVLLSQIGLMTIFALSYNMLMGQSGLLSFGHASLFGLGSYCAAHAMNAVKAGTFWLPTELIPLVGGLGGLGFGILLGYLATKQRATAFAMITMGMGELIAACALMFKGFFGGEDGITTDRVLGTSILGVSYSAPWQVYCLVVAWTAIATLLMRLQTQTPLGRMANATRDNFERAQFVGYDPRMVRFRQFAASGFFAGIAGGLYALVYQIVTFDTMSADTSAAALLAAYIGGSGSFYGPILGTILVVLLQSGVSLLSNAWMLYVGALFVIMVMFAPGGLAGLISRHEPIRRIGRLRALLIPYLRLLFPGFITVAGTVILVELTSFATIGSAEGQHLQIGARSIDPANGMPWLTGAVVLVVGGVWLRREARNFGVRWNMLIEDAKTKWTRP